MYIHYLSIILISTMWLLIFPIRIILDKQNNFLTTIIVFILIIINSLILSDGNLGWGLYTNSFNLNVFFTVITIIISFLLITGFLIVEFQIIKIYGNNLQLPKPSLNYILWVMCIAILEELVFRQITFYILLDKLYLCMPLTLLISTSVFSLNHIVGIKYKVSIIFKILLGFVLSFNYALFDSILLCIIMHMHYNIIYFIFVKKEWGLKKC